jgi:hypothetical protein
MSRVFVALACAGFVTFVGVARSQPASPERVTANRVTFEDARSENPAGIDISRVVVTSNAYGEIVFRVDIPTDSTFTDDMRIRIWVDSDDDPTTGLHSTGAGLLGGGDYFLLADNFGAELYGCSNPPACDTFGPKQQFSFGFSYRDGATFTIDADDLGKTKRFRFAVSAYDGLVYTPDVGYDFTNAHFDVAPGLNEWWTYDTRALLAKRFSATPTRARAGKQFTLALTTVRTDTGAVARGRVSCSFKTGGRSLAPRSRGFVRDAARCAFDIPASSRGKRFRSSITVVAAGHTLTRSVSGRIR